MVNAFAVMGAEGTVLVDAGLPNSVPKFRAVLAQQGRSLTDVTAIVVTHAHVDHAGGASELRDACDAPVVAHQAELPFLRGDQEMTYCPTGWFGRLFLGTGAPRERYPSLEPDVVVREEPIDLSAYGVRGRLEPTPGHTPGSLSVILDGGDALVGDLLASGLLLGGIALRGRAKRPPYEEQPALVAQELERLVHGGARQFYIGHGGPLPAEEVLRHTASLRKLDTPVSGE